MGAVDFTIPVRTSGSMTGSQFAASLMSMGMTPAREKVIFAQFAFGNVPQFMRTPVEIPLVADGHAGKIWALPDYLCIGDDEDFVRIPMTPTTAQRIADLYCATLPTRYLVKQIWRMAQVHLTPSTMSPTDKQNPMTGTKCFFDHSRHVELQRAGRTGLIAGHKKDIVLTPQLRQHPDCVAIYGWQQMDGTPIQGLNAMSHSSSYCDYSHGVRLISLEMEVDGQPLDFRTVYPNPALCALVSDEGPSTYLRYPTP